MERYRKRIVKTKLFFFTFFLLILSVLGCKGRPPEEIVKPPPIPEIEYLPVDYVFLLDNSGSIPRGEPRVFAREAIKAFVELSEVNDKISLIAFDEDARLLVSRVIQSQSDKDFIKNAVEEGLGFDGQYTDISKAFLFLTENRQNLFRGAGYNPAVILISDGKLQPKPPRNVNNAYQQMINSLNDLSGIPFYTIGLGETAIYEDFLPDINGLVLLRDKIATPTGGHFYHIRSVDALIETYFNILHLTKGISEVKGKHIFWVDESTKRISALVLKKTPKEDICTTSDMFIKDPQQREFTYPNIPADIRWVQGNYYDLITIDGPSLGKWQINLRNGRELEIFSILKRLINLRFKVEKSYWDNEKKIVLAWLYDERRKGLSDVPCEMTAKFDKKERFKESHHYISFKKAENDVYVAVLKSHNELKISPGDYVLQIIAKNEEKYFYRLTEPIEFNIKKSYFSFIFPEKVIKRWLYFWKGLDFKTIIDTNAESYPSFQEDPKLTLYLEKIEEGKIKPLPEIDLEKKVDGSEIIYSTHLSEIELGTYNTHFHIDGILKTGERVSIDSEDFLITVKRPAQEWGIFGFIGIFVIGTITWFSRPKLRGSISMVSPERRLISLKNHPKRKKSLRGDYLIFGPGGGELSDLRNAAFKICAMWRKRIKLEVIRGRMELKRGKERKLLTAGSPSELSRGDEISFRDDGVEFRLRKI